MAMMTAAIYDSFGGPIRIRQVPIPAVPEDGVLIKEKATGVCRSDWHGWKGHDGDIQNHGLPFCPGHEFSGIVVNVGPLCNFKVGDRVAIPFILSCGDCRYCCDYHQPTICAKQEQPGFTQYGSFAEYVAIPRANRNLRTLPANVSFVQAAALGCRFTTAYRAVLQQGELLRLSSENPSTTTTIAVFGCGGLGLSCVMIAVAAATEAKVQFSIIAIDVSESALIKAKELGATHTVLVDNKKSSDDPEYIAQDVKQYTPFADGADLTLDAAGFALTSQAAVYATRPGGRMVQVGLPHEPPKMPMGLVVGKELHLIGSHGFDAKDLPDLLALVATNSKIMDPSKLVERHVSLEEGCKALQDMDHTSPLGIVMITSFGSTDDDLRREGSFKNSRL
jgi:alcohol dehydrogenase